MRNIIPLLGALGISSQSVLAVSIDDINTAIAGAGSTGSVSLDLTGQNIILEQVPTGDPYLVPEWAAIINTSPDLVLNGLQADGSRASLAGGTTTSMTSQTRALMNDGGGSMNLSNINFKDCYYYRKGLGGKFGANGGAITNYSGTLTVSSCDFTGNVVRGYDRFSSGGAIASGMWEGKENTCFAFLTDCTFTRNIVTTDPAFEHSVQGGALVLDGTATIVRCSFTENAGIIGATKTGNLSAGGAISGAGTILIEDSSFLNNYITATENTDVAAGAIFISGSKGTTINRCVFQGNYIRTSGTGSGLGGALAFWDSSTTVNNVIADSSFFDNYNMSSSYHGGAIFTRGLLTLVADTQDVIFKGNKMRVTETLDGVPADGISNAITTTSAGNLKLLARNGRKIIFHDSLLASASNTPLVINPDVQDGDTWIASTQERSGEVVFGDGIKVENFHVKLNHGSLSLGNDSSIHGTISASTQSTLTINGFTTIKQGESVNLDTGITTGSFTKGAYNVTGTDGAHTIRINMNDAMASATDDRPVWSFLDGASVNAALGTLAFILDISGMENRPEELHPYIFSHTGSTDATKASVAGAQSVILMDSDGWHWEFQPYTVDGKTYDRFDFLSGQYGVAIPSISFQAPQGLGGNHVNTLWTTARSLRSFTETVHATARHRLKLDRNAAFWITGLGDYFTQENQDFSQGYSYRSLGYAAGGEYRISPAWTAGAAVGNLWGDHDVNDGYGRIDKDAVLGMLYARYNHSINSANALLLDFQAGYEYSRNKGDVRMSRLSPDMLEGRWSEQAWMLEAKASWRHALNKAVTLATYAGLQYTDAFQNDFSLSGEKYGYRVCNGRMNELKAMLGTEVSWTGTLGEHACMAYAGAGLLQDLSRETPRARVEGRQHVWTALGSKPGRTAVTASCGGRVQLSGDWSIAIGYTLEAAEKSLMQTGRASLVYEF